MLKILTGFAVALLSVQALAQSSGFVFDREEADALDRAGQTSARPNPPPARTQTTEPPNPPPAHIQTTEPANPPPARTQTTERTAAPRSPAAPARPPVIATSTRTPAEPSVTEKFKCEDDKYTDQTSEGIELFRRVLGIRDMRPGRYIVENDGYSGNRVIMKIGKGDNIELDLVSHDTQISGQMCVRGTGKNRRLEMKAKITGHGTFTIHIAKADGGMYLQGSGRLRMVLNFGYHVRSTNPETAAAR